MRPFHFCLSLTLTLTFGCHHRSPGDGTVVLARVGDSAITAHDLGAKVLMLEAGRRYDPATETPMFETAKDAPLRGVPTPDKHFGYFDATANGGDESGA